LIIVRNMFKLKCDPVNNNNATALCVMIIYV
jgi:hypothetical protein